MGKVKVKIIVKVVSGNVQWVYYVSPEASLMDLATAYMYLDKIKQLILEEEEKIKPKLKVESNG